MKPSFDPFHFLNDTSNIMAEIIKDELRKSSHLIDDKFKIISPYTLDRTLEGEKLQEKKYSRCLTAEMRTVVSPSGICLSPYRGNKNLQIGDANTESFREIWEGKTRKEIMEKLDPRKHCQFHCIRHNTNILLEKLPWRKYRKISDYYDLCKFYFLINKLT